MKKQLLVTLFALLLASQACDMTQKLPFTDGNQTTTTPQKNAVLYQDNFSNTNSGWPSLTDADGITDYDAGFYRIKVDTIGLEGNGMNIWAHPGQDIKGDVRVEVDATKIGGPDANEMGVLCRYTKKNKNYNFYYFVITSDGFAGIAKMASDTPTLISGNELNASDAIHKTGSNHIRADCLGEKLTLYINNKLAATATDNEFTGGDIGLIAGTDKTTGVDIHFDNLIVTVP